MKNIHFLSSDKPSPLGLHYDIVKIGMFDYAPNLGFNLFDRKNNFQHRPHHLYITSDEEIKEGDWVIHNTFNSYPLKFERKDGDAVMLSRINLDSCSRLALKDCKKIILTTDLDLIKDGVQEIEENFLRWFVEKANDSGRPIDIVEVRKEKYSERFDNQKEVIGNPDTWGNRYKLIYSLEKKPYLEQHLEEVIDPKGVRRSAQLSPFEAKLIREAEVYKKEMIASGRTHRVSYTEAIKLDFISGAKWQEQRSFNLEEALVIWKAGQEYWKTSGESITFEELVEQLKKK